MMRRHGTEMGKNGAQGTPQIELNIEHLVLHGFGHLDGAELSAVVEQALSQILAERGVPSLLSRGGDVDGLDGGTLTARPDASAHDIGGQIAQAVYRSFES